MEYRGHEARLTAARRVITGITAVVGLSVVIALGMIISMILSTPSRRVTAWHNTLLSTGMVVSGLLALRWIRTSLQRGMVFYALANTGMVAAMYVLNYQAYLRNLVPSYEFSSALYVPHLGILLVALIAGLRPALGTAAGGVAYLLLMSQFMPDPWMVATPIVIALGLPFTATLVERLLDEAEKEAHRARLAETSIEVMTHDMGSPLAVLVSSLEILEDELLPEQRESLMLAIQRNTDTLRRLLDEFRETPHLDQAARMEMMGLHRIVNDVVDLYARPTCKKRGQTLHAHLEPVEIVGNPPRLSRVTRELLTNAMKFTPRGGHIEVTLHAADQAILRVSDNGWGFKEEELTHVFKQYWRGSSASAGLASGTGLGLFICKQFVESHGGRIEVESQEDKGSTFTIYLPLAEATTA